MAKELVIEKWSNIVSVVEIGATRSEGGSRSKVIRVGGEVTLPCLFREGAIPDKPVIAFEVWDTAPSDWPDGPVSWAEKYLKENKADLVCLRLQGAHPDSGNKSPEEEAKLLKNFLKKIDLPMIIIGCGDDAKDNLILPACCQITKGEKCLIGSAVSDNYKTITAAVLADGHSIIAESPIDINIAKQLNILISDMGLALNRIVINPTIGALGYGLEYAYSIMERARLAALAGDKTVASPFICFVGQEAWRVKEAKTGSLEQGIVWEAITATALIQAGADILVMRHAKAIEEVRKYIDKLWS